MPTEADTCRTLITPKLQAAGWELEPHSIAEQRAFTDGRIIVHGSTATRRKFPPGFFDLVVVDECHRGSAREESNWREILDYTGTATRNFADPAFDGDLAFATQEEIDEHGQTKSMEVVTPEEPEDTESAKGTIAEAPLSSSTEEWASVRSRKYYFDGGQVEIVTELVHELDADGKQLRVVKLTDYTAEKVRSLFARPEDLRASWADATRRADIIHQLAERGIDFQQVAAQAGQPDADPFDLLCHLAFNAPILTRRQRADRVKKKQTAMSNYLKPEAQEILNELLEKYAADGELQFILPDVLKLPPISQRGSRNWPPKNERKEFYASLSGPKWWINGKRKDSDQGWVEVFKLSGWKCIFCGRDLAASTDALVEATEEHLVPWTLCSPPFLTAHSKENCEDRIYRIYRIHSIGRSAKSSTAISSCGGSLHHRPQKHFPVDRCGGVVLGDRPSRGCGGDCRRRRLEHPAGILSGVAG